MGARLTAAIAMSLMAATGASAETIQGLPVHMHRFDSGAIRVWVGDHISSTAMVAIPTSAGIIVIDTTAARVSLSTALVRDVAARGFVAARQAFLDA